MNAPLIDKSDVMRRICDVLAENDSQLAVGIIQSDYPFMKPTSIERRITPNRAIRIFHRDGFIDRYSGKRLVFPGVLKLISKLLPVEFPYHKNWKMDSCHIAFWELFPTVDHLDPVARGGSNDDDDNLLTTSMLRNSSKSNWTLDELDWSIKPEGNYQEWDGLTAWFLEFVKHNPSHLQDPYLRTWHKAAEQHFDIPGMSAL